MDWVERDRMNECIVDKAWAFKFEAFQGTYQNKTQKRVDSIAYALDCAITAKHSLLAILEREPSTSRWHSPASLPDTDGMGERAIPPGDFERRWDCDVCKLVKHLIKKHEGEVVEVNGYWREMTGAQATLGSFFMHKQFATSAMQSETMSRRFSGKSAGYIEHPSAVGDTTIIKTHGTRLCHREGWAFSLPEMLLAWWDEFSCQQLYSFYNNCAILVRKRDHPWASLDRRAAAHLRKKETGRWGFGDA